MKKSLEGYTRRESKIDEYIDQVVKILKQYGDMQRFRLEKIVNFEGVLTSTSKHSTFTRIVKAGEELKKFYVDRSEKPYIVSLNPPKTRPVVHKKPIEKIEVPKERPSLSYAALGLDEDEVKEKKTELPIRDLIKSNKLGIRLGPEGENWIKLRMGCGPGMTSRELLEALQKHGSVIDVEELLKKYHVFLTRSEQDIEMLKALRREKVIELYEI